MWIHDSSFGPSRSCADCIQADFSVNLVPCDRLLGKENSQNCGPSVHIFPPVIRVESMLALEHLPTVSIYAQHMELENSEDNLEKFQIKTSPVGSDITLTRRKRA